MRRLSCCAILIVVILAAAPAAAQEGAAAPAAPPLKSAADVEAFLDGWDGSAAELQAVYEGLDPATRALVDALVEFWSIEGGLSVMGGAQGVGGDLSGLFRLEASIGVAWPVGDYSLPIYYAVDDITWPWAAGFQVYGGVDNLSSAFYGGASLRLAYDYVGTTPYLDLGPAVRYGEDALAFGGRLAGGYGNILLQGWAAVEYYAADDPLWTVTAGIRLPWVLLMPSTWEILADYL